MAIVDARGRLFGRLNLLDAVVLLLIAGLVPIGFAAFVLFRERPARIVSVAPTQVDQADEVRITLTGENLRPYMRVSAGVHQASGYTFKSTTEAEVPFLNLPPGEHDIILYDYAQERFRVPKGLTVRPSPLAATYMIAVGLFGNLDAAMAAKVTAGMSLEGLGEVIRTGPPGPDRTTVFAGSARVGVRVPDAVGVPAALRLRCDISVSQGRADCKVRDVPLSPTALLFMPTPVGTVPFLVDQIRSVEPLREIEVRVRFSGHPAVLSLIEPGHADRGGTANDLAAGAVVIRVEPLRRLSDTTAEREAVVRAELQQAGQGWLYDSAPLRAGDAFALRTPRYVVHGTVTQLAAPAPRGGTTR